MNSVENFKLAQLRKLFIMFKCSHMQSFNFSGVEKVGFFLFFNFKLVWIMDKFKFYRAVGPTQSFKPTVAPSHSGHAPIQEERATPRAARFSPDQVAGSLGPTALCLSPSASPPIKGPPWRGETSLFYLPADVFWAPLPPLLTASKLELQPPILWFLPLWHSPRKGSWCFCPYFCSTSPTPHLATALRWSPVSSLFWGSHHQQRVA
jgi:hypothetical protein